jgi:hypothetical protein
LYLAVGLYSQFGFDAVGCMYAEEGGGVVGVVCKDAEFGRWLVGEVESAEWAGGEVVF